MLTLTELDQDLLQNLNRHPLLRARVESLLNVVENTAGDLEKADDAERRVIDELRQMGNEALTSWAERGVAKSSIEIKANPNLRPAGKKTLLAHDVRQS